MTTLRKSRLPDPHQMERVRQRQASPPAHGTYRRRSTVCHPAPIRTEAEGEGENCFGADHGRTVEPPGPYPGPQPGPGYPSPGYPPPSPPGFGPEQGPRCDQLAQVEQETVARLQFTPPSPERAAMEQQLRDIGVARQS